MYILLSVSLLSFVFFLNKSRARYRNRDYREPKISHGIIIVFVNIVFELAYRYIYNPQIAKASETSVFLVYWLPQIIFYLCLVTTFLLMSYAFGLFIWPDTKNKINQSHSLNIPICFLLSLFVFYPSLMRNGLVENTAVMLVSSLIAGGLTSIYLVRILVIKFNANN